MILEAVVMHNGHVRRAHVRAVDSKWVILRMIGFDVEDKIHSLAEEGVAWARGWDEETSSALRAAYALRDPP